MGLFQGKKVKQNPESEVEQEAAAVFDDNYREELRELGRKHLKKLIDANAENLKKDIDETVESVSHNLNDYMAKKVNEAVEHINSSLNEQLNKRLADNDQMIRNSYELVSKSLDRNAQSLHEKYQQMSTSMQKTVADQEAAMISVFEEHKARMAAAQNKQDEILQSLKQTTDTTRQHSEQLGDQLQRTVTSQQESLNKVFEENMARVNETKTAQETSLATLNQSAEALKKQSEELMATMQQDVDEQKAALVQAFQNNMAQIVEHYLLGAVGEQYDLKAQLPSIIKQMEANQQAIADDMKL